MTPLLRSILIVLFFSFAFIGKANAQREKPKGGSCSYKTEIFPATVIMVANIDSIRVFILFSVEKYGTIDTISYYSEFHIHPGKEVIDKYDLRVGNVFNYEVKSIISGHCSPHIERLMLTKYVSPAEVPGN
ncbi:hypothetical protein BH11BAC7_BH11BAC7_12970 [soil metagenome]